MKKISLLFLIIPVLTLSSYSQNNLERAVAKYFKVNPLDRKFSVFLNQVMEDTLFVIDKLEKRTDSIPFYLRGHYKTFNPFVFKPTIVQFVITEVILPYNSGTAQWDTIMVCEITAVTNIKSGPEQEDEVKNQFKFFERKYGKGYITAATDDIIINKTKLGEVREYYASMPLYLPVLAISWGKIANSESFAFSILLRIKIKENFAALPIPPDRS